MRLPDIQISGTSSHELARRRLASLGAGSGTPTYVPPPPPQSPPPQSSGGTYDSTVRGEGGSGRY